MCLLPLVQYYLCFFSPCWFLKGIDHYWTYFPIFSRGRRRKWRANGAAFSGQFTQEEKGADRIGVILCDGVWLDHFNIGCDSTRREWLSEVFSSKKSADPKEDAELFLSRWRCRIAQLKPFVQKKKKAPTQKEDAELFLSRWRCRIACAIWNPFVPIWEPPFASQAAQGSTRVETGATGHQLLHGEFGLREV